MDKNYFKIMSYNSTGMASDKQGFLNEMILKYDPDIIFLQETWLINSQRNVGIYVTYIWQMAFQLSGTMS